MSTEIRIPAVSKEYYRAKVTVTKAGVAYDPTQDLVEFQFTDGDEEPDGAGWTAGSWETIDSEHFAMVLVGPGQLVLAKGTHYAWLRVTDAPEVPARRVGTVRIF